MRKTGNTFRWWGRFTIYCWDGTRRTLVRVPDHPLTVPQEDGMRRFAINGPQAFLVLKDAGSFASLQIVLLEFQPANPGKTPGRVQFDIYPRREIILPTRGQPGLRRRSRHEPLLAVGRR